LCGIPGLIEAAIGGKRLSDKPSLPLPRLLRAPVVWVGFVISLYVSGVFFAVVSVGAWAEDALRWLGVKRLDGLSAAAGVGGFLLLGVAGPAWLGNRLLGWPGLIVGPLLVMGLVALLDRW
jgi:hypothetical protein